MGGMVMGQCEDRQRKSCIAQIDYKYFQGGSLEKKCQYVTNAFTTTCDYLVLQLIFFPLRLLGHHVNINQVTHN
jgi:hypothetical protein